MACALLFCIICMRDNWFLIYLSIIFSKSVILFSSEGLWKEDCGEGLEKFVDNWKNQIDDWKNYDGNWVDDWKNYDYNWDVRSVLTLSGHCCF